MQLKTLLNRHDTVLDFWQDLEDHGGRLLFEEYGAMYYKATLPGDTYWLGEDVIPPHVSKQYNFAHILKGKRSIGCDVVNIHNGRAVGYEGKWFDRKKKTIQWNKVSPKQQVINKTGIDQLIVYTNAVKSSDMITEYSEETGFDFLDTFLNQQAFETVRKYANNQEKFIYSPMLPRDSFFEGALDDIDKDVTLGYGHLTLKDITVRILQHWPAASGKSSFPRLSYDRTIEKFWDYKKGNPINLVVNPSLVILKGNLMKQIEHDIALGNDTVHIIFAGDVRKAVKDKRELQAIRHLAKVFTTRKDFVKFIRENDKTSWIHTTNHSYSQLARSLRKEKKTVFFSHIDEVHHTIQPDFSTWTGPLDDTMLPVNFRFMSSANIRSARGKGASWSMDDPLFADIHVKELTEKMAVQLGYKRQTKIINYVYDSNHWPVEWIEQFEKNSEPLVRLKDTDLVVPIGWFLAADSLIRFRIEHSRIQHTKITINGISDGVKFERFFNTIKPQLLREYASSNSKIYRRLLKAETLMCDTHNKSTVEILRDVQAIPKMHHDSFVIHDRLLGEGFDPEGGWMDSNMFVTPTFSEIRIYQDVNRGSRIGDGSKKINWLVIASLNDVDNYNKMFANISRIGDALDIGEEDIRETVTFKAVKPMPKGKKLGKKGQDANTYYDEIDANFVSDCFSNYVKQGHYYKFGDVVNQIFEEWLRLDKELVNTTSHLTYTQKTREIKDKVIQKFPDYFSHYRGKRKDVQILEISKGRHYLLSEINQDEALEWEIKKENILNRRIEKIREEYRHLKLSLYDPAVKRDVPNTVLCKKYKLKSHELSQHIKDIDNDLNKNVKHYTNQKWKVFKILIKVAQSKSIEKIPMWADLAMPLIKDQNILGLTKSTINEKFLFGKLKYLLNNNQRKTWDNCRSKVRKYCVLRGVANSNKSMKGKEQKGRVIIADSQTFISQAQCARHYKVDHVTISNWLKKYPNRFYYKKAD